MSTMVVSYSFLDVTWKLPLTRHQISYFAVIGADNLVFVMRKRLGLRFIGLAGLEKNTAPRIKYRQQTIIPRFESLSDTEIREDLAEDFFGRGLANNLAKSGGCVPGLERHQFEFASCRERARGEFN